MLAPVEELVVPVRTRDGPKPKLGVGIRLLLISYMERMGFVKKFLCLAILLAVVSSVVGCGTTTTPAATPPKTSDKP